MKGIIFFLVNVSWQKLLVLLGSFHSTNIASLDYQGSGGSLYNSLQEKNFNSLEDCKRYLENFLLLRGIEYSEKIEL